MATAGGTGRIGRALPLSAEMHLVNSGFRLLCGVEVRGDRKQKGWDLAEFNAFRGLKVGKENHFVFIVAGGAREHFECLQRFPFHGIVDQLRRRASAHHDKLHCMACDFLGQHCGASHSRTIAKSFAKGGRLILKGLTAAADESFVHDVMTDALQMKTWS